MSTLLLGSRQGSSSLVSGDVFIAGSIITTIAIGEVPFTHSLCLYRLASVVRQSLPPPLVLTDIGFNSGVSIYFGAYNLLASSLYLKLDVSMVYL